MKIEGYAWIVKNPTTHKGLGTPEDFAGKILPFLEMTPEGDVLILAENKLAMFDKIDVLKSFRCCIEGGFVLPPGGSILENMTWLGVALEKSDGDARLFNAAVIGVSIQMGKYYDQILK